jgi:hypothetical protein
MRDFELYQVVLRLQAPLERHQRGAERAGATGDRHRGCWRGAQGTIGRASGVAPATSNQSRLPPLGNGSPLGNFLFIPGCSECFRPDVA